jgi:hypothetical protein
VAPLSADRRNRLIRRGIPALAGAAAVALVAGAAIGSLAENGSVRAARDFTRAWERGDYERMHSLLTPEAARRYRLSALREAYRNTAATATAVAVSVGDPRDAGGERVAVPVRIRTRIFETIGGEVELPVVGERIDWRPSLAFPGLRPGLTLTRTTETPERAKLLGRDGGTIAEGPAAARTSPLGPDSIAGRLSPPETRAARDRLYARGFPTTTPIGQSGLERAFETRLAGRPGGQLILGGRVIARAAADAAAPVRTTIDTRLQTAAAVALAGRLGGVAALDPRSGEVLALSGIAFSAPQPPGSTFKIITTTAALEAGAVRLSDRFPVQTAATIDGVELENANGELCGGTFTDSFAHSCNSVFAPLGEKVGARKLVEVAERYGFNAEPELAGEAPSTIPPAGEIRTPLEVGSTAIGQFKLLATPLRMASVAQTVAAGGVRLDPTLVPRGGEALAGARRTRVTSARIARTLRALMERAVSSGTGLAAAIPGIRVAGKTGTAELEDTRGPNAPDEPDDESNTDAWFTAFAPADRPRIAVAVLLVRAGAGGATAAPAARVVIQAALAPPS